MAQVQVQVQAEEQTHTLEITEGIEKLKLANNNENHKKNRIQVSNTKKPLFFYVNLAKVVSVLSFRRPSDFVLLRLPSFVVFSSFRVLCDDH
ncbi:hypothetical protein KI387_004146, partial [Taxus chinensis]